MKFPIYSLFFLLSCCVPRPTESDVLCLLSYSVPTNSSTTSILSYKNDVYLSSDSYLKVYKMDSLGCYRDWTQNFYSLSFILAMEDTVFIEMNDENIREEKSVLKREFIGKMNPADSIEHEILKDEFDIKMHNTVPLVRMRFQKAEISLSPLKQEGGCYKLAFFYQPKDFISLRGEKFTLPERIGRFQRYKESFMSNELHLCY